MDFSDCDSIGREVLLLYSDMESNITELQISELELMLCLALDHHNKIKKKQMNHKACWAKPWLLRRTSFGLYENLMKELVLEDMHSFRTL